MGSKSGQMGSMKLKWAQMVLNRLMGLIRLKWTLMGSDGQKWAQIGTKEKYAAHHLGTNGLKIGLNRLQCWQMGKNGLK